MKLISGNKFTINLGKQVDYAYSAEYYLKDKRRVKELLKYKKSLEERIRFLIGQLEKMRSEFTRMKTYEDKKYYREQYEKALEELHMQQRLLEKVKDTIWDAKDKWNDVKVW